MRSRFGSVALGLFAATTALGVVPAVAVRADAAVPGQLLVVAQQFEVGLSNSFVVDLQWPDTLQAGDLSDATVRVTAYARATSRAAVQAAADGALPRQVDSVQLPLSGMPSNASADLEVVVPIETDTRTTAALQLARAGVYPVKVEILSRSTVVATVTTFVHCLDDREEPLLPLQVTAVAGTTTTVAVDDNSEVSVDDAALAELGQLADVLRTAAIPVTVRVAPAVVAAAAADGDGGAAVTTALHDALADDDLIAQPMLPLDPSAAAAAS
ncbi:MAG TPA: hypothetical protein PLV13_02075, partial [Ilumatobacteraceae bacterium]|nr:hypothetical protein [Ilumatobacteraceae bacterium]